MGEFNDRALDLMEAQLGLITRPQLLAVGHTHGEIAGKLRRRKIAALFCGTYRLPGSAAPPEQTLMGAALRCRPRAWITGAAALGLLGIEGFGVADAYAVVVPPGRRVQNVPFEIVEDDLPAGERALFDPIPITVVHRSIVHVAQTVSGKPLRVAVDSARWTRVLNLDRLRRCARRLSHTIGGQRVLGMLDDGCFDQESEGERKLVPVIGDLQPPPRWQHWIAPDIRVDAALVDVPLIVEYLGEETHGPTHRRIADHERARRIRGLGYESLYVCDADLKNPALLRSRILGIREGLLAVPRLRAGS
ncbi:hypothetical protein BH20ACT8_BH20ACT8_15270 [soil metagenome]